MISTNLLGKYARVTLHPENIILAEIVLVCNEGRAIDFVVADVKTGKLYQVPSISMCLDDPKEYHVVIFYEDAKKINTIRVLREFRELGLRDAKDLVESGKELILKDKLTLAEAQEIIRRLKMSNLECEARKSL